MLIKYTFATGEVNTIEVDDSLGNFIIDSRRTEDSADRKHRRHCWSMDAIDYEGLEYADPEDFTEKLIDDTLERNARIKEAFSKLTEVQQRRMLMVANGLSLREIARREGKDIKTIRESVEAARAKFKKFF